MKKFLTTVALVAAFTAGALAMPGDQAEAVQLAGEAPLDLDFGPLNLDLGALMAAEADIEAPPALESAVDLDSQREFDEYMALTPEEQQALFALFYALQPGDLVGLSDDELTMLAIKYGAAAGPWDKIKCTVCSKVVGFFIGKVRSFGCGKVNQFATAVCNVAGLGPLNPVTLICRGAVAVACPIVAKYIANKITTPAKVCKGIRWC